MYCSQEQVRRRLCLIHGLANQSHLDKNLPNVISRLCDKYASDAIYWRIDNDKLQYLLSNNAEIAHYKMQMDSFKFILALTNEQGSIILKIFPIKSEMQCTDRVYVELYCIETKSQYKTSHLFNTGYNPRSSHLFSLHGSSRYPPCKWSNLHLTAAECVNKRSLTFGIHLKIQDEPECEILLPSNISYQWNLNTVSSILPKKYCKIYSSNFGNDCFCLSYQIDPTNKELIQIGLQLLKLPNDIKNGLIFKCVVDYEGNSNAIEFIYFLDMFHTQVDLGKIHKNTNWIKITIHDKTD